MAKKAKMPVEKLDVKSTAAPERNIASRNSDVEYEARERKYRAESALRTIEEAEAHKRDKGLMKDVKACAKEKKKTYDKL